MAAAVFFAVLAAAAMWQSTDAATYIVGDSTGWTIPPGNTALYENWADNKNFHVGDVLVFNFTTGAHDVAQVTSESDYENCNKTATTNIERNGPANITLNTTGDHYYICTFGTHCSQGQKLKIDVENDTGASTPGSSPTPTTPSGTTSPSSTSSLVATLSLVFISIALVLFC